MTYAILVIDQASNWEVVLAYFTCNVYKEIVLCFDCLYDTIGQTLRPLEAYLSAKLDYTKRFLCWFGAWYGLGGRFGYLGSRDYVLFYK